MVCYDHREDVGFAVGDRREEEYCGRQRVEGKKSRREGRYGNKENKTLI